MAHAPLPIAPAPAPTPTPAQHHFGGTMRQDAWWLQPALIFFGLVAFLVYATWAAFQGDHYTYGPYLSPFYSPEIYGDSPHNWFGPKPAWWPSWHKFSPALLVLPVPGLFRLTCYYYRGAYYKAFWADPPACMVGEPRAHYRGEHSFPLILQNIHRYFLYIAVAFLVILLGDVYRAFWFTDATGRVSFGIGVGTLILVGNLALLGGYTFGCHAMRHVVGGYVRQLSRQPVRKRAYDCVSCLNRAHMRWAWLSLVSVPFADLYIRLCSMGIWTDWRLF